MVNGDFAGAVYNEKDKTWTLFRDHMGVRPLFYYMDDTVFAFSTDIIGLLALPGVNTSLNEEKFYLRMMGYNDLTLCNTEFAGIHCVRPASVKTVSQNTSGFSENEMVYWKLKQKKIRMKTDEEYFTELRRLVTDSVKRRLDAVSGIVGGELSGGMDSSVIAILISRLGRKGPYFSWSWSPEEFPLQEGDDERKIIFDICRQENIVCEFSPKQKNEKTEDFLNKIIPPHINTQSLSDGSAWLKSQGARVVFTGHGGDEGVSHRCSPFELWYHKEYLSFVRIFWDRTKGKKLRLLRTAKRMMHQIVVENPRYLKPYENKGVTARRFLNETFKERMDEKKQLQPLYFAYDPAAYFEQGGPRVRLDNVAYHGAQNGVRYMVPFLDYRVIDFAVSIPRRLYLGKGTNRYIYRQAFRKLMPESLYKMQYKDTASQRNYQPDETFWSGFSQEKKLVVSKLDREYWKDYLNFEEIDQFADAVEYTRSDYTRSAIILSDLISCYMLQNVKDNAVKLV